MDELEIKGKTYISSKRAAELTGYAKDYVGQLARAGKIAGTRMGRAWYVEEEALLAHKKTDIQEKSLLSRIQTIAPLRYSGRDLPDTWVPASYSKDDSDLMPMPTRDFQPVAMNVLEVVEKPSHISPILENEIRIKILDARIRPPVIEKARKIRRKRSVSPIGLSLGALAAALCLLLFFISGFFLSSDVHLSGNANTASVLVGFENIRDILKQLGW